MDQMSLTGLVSFRFSSLADGSPPEDSVTAPKLKFSPLCKGIRSETCASGAKDPPIASSLTSVTRGPSSPQITGTLGFLSAAFVVTAVSNAAHVTTTVVNTYSHLQ